MKDTATSPTSAAESRALTRTLEIRTSRRTELKNITAEVARFLAESGCKSGVCHVYVPHTTAGVIVN
ncbi:MAG TPA: YjbQ family protein, partial [Candidatus Acidoferrales bacterium]|nr:YjbQ family protein [Candidatus Acidoferrales bacterium]